MLNIAAAPLCCPDDLGRLSINEDYAQCERCGRHFQRLARHVFDLRPSVPSQVNRKLAEGYLRISKEPSLLKLYDDVNGWGYLPSAPPGYRGFVNSERAAISKLARGKNGGVLADVSGGVGNYTTYLAGAFDHVIHCELHVASLATAVRAGTGYPNMIFLRSDYMSLPIASASIDVVMCTDTLERGRDHERHLLNEIARILKDDGLAVIDFHNDRLSSIMKRSEEVAFYTLAEFQELVQAAGLICERALPIGFVPSRLVIVDSIYRALDLLFGFVLPPARYLLTLSKRKH